MRHAFRIFSVLLALGFIVGSTASAMASGDGLLDLGVEETVVDVTDVAGALADDDAPVTDIDDVEVANVAGALVDDGAAVAETGVIDLAITDTLHGADILNGGVINVDDTIQDDATNDSTLLADNDLDLLNRMVGDGGIELDHAAAIDDELVTADLLTEVDSGILTNQVDGASVSGGLVTADLVDDESLGADVIDLDGITSNGGVTAFGDAGADLSRTVIQRMEAPQTAPQSITSLPVAGSGMADGTPSGLVWMFAAIAAALALAGAGVRRLPGAGAPALATVRPYRASGGIRRGQSHFPRSIAFNRRRPSEHVHAWAHRPWCATRRVLIA